MPQHLETIFAIVGFIQAQISILLCWGLVSCINEVCSNKKKKPFSRSNLFILCFWTFYFWVSFSWVQRKWTNFRLAISRLQTVTICVDKSCVVAYGGGTPPYKMRKLQDLEFKHIYTGKWKVLSANFKRTHWAFQPAAESQWSRTI